MYYPNFEHHPPHFPPPRYPAYQAKPEPPSQYLRHNENYWWPLGTLRLLIILSTLGGIISAWLVCFSAVLLSVFPGAMSTQAGCIVIFSVFFSLSLFIFLMSVTNFVNLPGIDSYYYLLTFTIIDICGGIALIGVGIGAAVQEAYLSPFSILAGYRPGTFTACAVFGIFGGIVELVCAGYQAWVIYEMEYK